MASTTQNIAVIVPAHNEAQSIGIVVSELCALKQPESGLALLSQIVVANNGSQDETVGVARQNGAIVVNEDRLGYGYACLAAMD